MNHTLLSWDQCLASMGAGMELRHLRYFVAVAEAGSLTVAAQNLHTSQPSLSRQIRDLEDEIGVQLLRPATDGLSMSTDAASNFRLVYALPQQFGRLTAALFQPYEVPANSCWISHAETVAQKIRNVTILCDHQ